MLHALRMSSTANKLLALAAVSVCAYFSFSFLFLILSTFWPGPLFDYWIDIANVERFFNNSLTFHDLITAHNNAHRILIPRLLFILDYRFFSGANVLLVSISILCKLSLIVLFNLILKNETLKTKLLLNALIFSALLNAGNVYNIVFNSDIQWDLVSVFACYAIFLYVRAFQSSKPVFYRVLAYAFLLLGLLSHAGALSIIFVFIAISAFNKKWIDVALNLIVCLIIFYTNSLLPFSDPQNPDIQSAFATLILHADTVAIFVTKFISGSLVFHLGSPGLYFSFYLLLLLILFLIYSRKTRHIYNNLFLFFSLFLFLMIISIAAARTIFNPNVWAASRFQTTVLLFILCVHIHAWLIVPVLIKNAIQKIIQWIILAHGLILFFMVQYFHYNIPYKLSNAVFFSHAYMLTHERNQNNGPRLLLWLHDKDVIADSDPFFRKNAFAWYANKQGGNAEYRDFMDVGKALVSPENIDAFKNSCTTQLPTLTTHWTKDGGIEFATPLHDGLKAMLHRNTYYALDKNGVVVGFAYIMVNEKGFYKTASLEGYSMSYDIAAFAEIGSDDKPTCLYAAAQGE